MRLIVPSISLRGMILVLILERDETNLRGSALSFHTSRLRKQNNFQIEAVAKAP